MNFGKHDPNLQVMHKVFRTITSALLLTFGGWAFAQTGITDLATVELVPGGPDCDGLCPTVDVFVDVTGLVGNGGEAGLNAFVLAFEMDRSEVFASAQPGTDPNLEWYFLTTRGDLVAATDRVILVGVVGDPMAPNASYHVGKLLLCGAAGTVTLSLDLATSSLGSRVVGEDAPGPIGIQATSLWCDGPIPLTCPVTISVDFNLEFLIAVASWRTMVPAYDLADPEGSIDVLDIAKLVDCGEP